LPTGQYFLRKGYSWDCKTSLNYSGLLCWGRFPFEWFFIWSVLYQFFTSSSYHCLFWD